MKKRLVATITFNADRITNECFIQSLYKYNSPDKFDLWIVSTSDKDFSLDSKFNYDNITILNFKKSYNISSHAPAIQKIIDIIKNHQQYEELLIVENDTIVKCDLSGMCDANFQVVGNYVNQSWTLLTKDACLFGGRIQPMLMYFNLNSFNGREISYYKSDVSVVINIPSLNISKQFENTYFADPGWYFHLWITTNRVKYKNVDIWEYISHFWYGSESRGQNKSIEDYNNRLREFKENNKEHLL